MKRDRWAFRQGRLWAFIAVAIVAAVVALLAVNPAKERDAMAKKTPELFDSGVPRGESEALARLFADANARLRQVVLHPKGLTQGSREFRAARAAEQIEQINRMLARLGAAGQVWIERNVPRAYGEGIARAHQQAIEAGVRAEGSALRGGFSVIDERAARIFAHDIASDLQKAVNSMSQTAEKILRQTAQIGLDESGIDQILAGGVIEGTPRETVRALKEELERVNNGSTVTVRTKSGGTMDFDAGYYAEMVVRTKTRQATVAARHNRLADLGLDLVMIVGRISDYPCTAFLGQVYSLSGRHPKYPAYGSLPGGGPPFHPKCSKSSRPFVEELAEARELAMAEPDGDVKKLIRLADGDFTKLAKPYKDLQMRSQVTGRYKTTEKELFG